MEKIRLRRFDGAVLGSRAAAREKSYTTADGLRRGREEDGQLGCVRFTAAEGVVTKEVTEVATARRLVNPCRCR